MDTGLFLDHRKTRILCKELSEGAHVLNLFAYTGSFTCYAIEGGALSTTTVDLSKTYTEWTKRNLQLNDMHNRDSDRVIVADCLSYLKTDKRVYDLIICDPPTFSNSKKMETTFSVERDYKELLIDCINRLSPTGTIIFSTNAKGFKLDTDNFPKSLTITNITMKTLSKEYRDRQPHQCWYLTKNNKIKK